MSYLDQTRRKNPASVAAVVGVHLAVGYALMIGLGYTVIPFVPKRTVIFNVPNVPPPPTRHETPQHTKQVVTNPIEKQPEILKSLPPTITTPTFPDTGIERTSTVGDGPAVVPPQPPKANLAKDAAPARNWRQWITTDDYPTSLIRQDVQGLVVISVTIGTDGRIRSCLVTQSSGNRLLDDTTCRLYTQRARFTPARDADGNPTIAQRTDRYRWQIPNE